jgi:signal transduction histidine kinase
MLIAKDDLYRQAKQNLSFNEQAYQRELANEKTQLQSKIKIYALLGVVIVFLLAASLLYRSNQQKQKAYSLLQKQKNEIDLQKEKVECTLEELKSTQAQLIQSEKMASLGELTAGIAHEIQNPLNFVNNFSDVNKEMLEELKAERLKPDAERDENLQDELINDVIANEQKINHHGKRADAIVKGMLQHSRKSSGQKEPTDINALADEYLRLSYHGLRAKDKSFNATIETNFDQSIGKINVIPQEIGRVLLNLFNNAFYACTERRRSAVNEQKSANLISYEPKVSVTTKKSENRVCITVSDNGNGIPQKIIDKIFQPFFTTKPTGEGTGLGLSLSYDIIKAHGGEIKVESKEGEGTDFIIQVPYL